MQCFTSFQIDASLLFLQKGDSVPQDMIPKEVADKWDIQRDPCTWHIMTLHMCPMGPAVQQFLAASSATLRSSASVAPFLPPCFHYTVFMAV